MPKIQISKKLLYTLLGYTPSFKELEQDLIYAKAEIDEPDDNDDHFKIELNDTNRPDLWSAAGLARQLITHKKQPTEPNKNSYEFFKETPHPTKKIIVDKRLKDIRPYVLGFIISGKTVSEEILTELIQTQEKLCEHFGQKRHAVAIGIYREDQIQWPVHYDAVDPHTTKFVPLDFTDELSLYEILEQHPKGKEYGHLIKNNTLFPFLQDNDKKVLSLPPIINSAHVGAVQIGDNQLFVECTGHNIEQLMLVTNIFACDCQCLGFIITRINSEYPYTPGNSLQHIYTSENNVYTIPSPTHFQSSMTITIQEIINMLGVTLTIKEATLALLRMNVNATILDDTSIEVKIPPYRNDFLHMVDIIEDVMMGRGMDTFKPEYPRNFTIGRLTDIEHFSRKVINTMVGLGFQEMIFPYLGSRVNFIEKLYEPEEWNTVQNTMIQVSNPISENYEFVRTSIIPNLLESEHVSAHSPYPHRMCEIGKIAMRDENEVLGSRTDTVLGLLIADTQIGFTDINSIIAAIFYYLNIEWYPKEGYDSRFIQGRSAILLRKVAHGDDVALGIFGEVHPRILNSFNINMPCVAGEITIDKML